VIEKKKYSTAIRTDQTNQKKLQQFKTPIAQNMKPNHKQVNLQLCNQQQNRIKKIEKHASVEGPHQNYFP
jgi:50S ribosomal subunit-associated GTPase HflX